jgi:YD repeat-containing protein
VEDSYGNRTLEAFSTAACANNPTPQAKAVYNSANNRISSSTASPATVAAGSYVYDASGNTLYDGNNRYWYDAEGQLCAEQSQRTTGAAIYQYVYDAEGARIGKAFVGQAPASGATCTPYSTTAMVPNTSTPLFNLQARWLVDQGGDQVTEFNNNSGAYAWAHSNVWAGGKLTATYDTKGIHYELADPLGTKRVQANALGQVEENCTSLPFGNDLNNPPGNL